MNNRASFRKLQSLINRLDNVPQDIERVGQSIAEWLLQRLTDTINSQDFSVAPLSPAYRERKIREGYYRQILIRTAEYVDNLRAWRQQNGVWMVGPDPDVVHNSGFPLPMLAAYLEFGDPFRQTYLPPRPVYQQLYMRLKNSDQFERIYNQYFGNRL